MHKLKINQIAEKYSIAISNYRIVDIPIILKHNSSNSMHAVVAKLDALRSLNFSEPVTTDFDNSNTPDNARTAPGRTRYSKVASSIVYRYKLIARYLDTTLKNFALTPE